MATSQVVARKHNVVHCPQCAGEGFLHGSGGKDGRCPRCAGSGKLAIREGEDGKFKESSILYD